MMVPKVSSVYQLNIQKHNHQQDRDEGKKKEKIQFKDVLAKAINGVAGYKR